MNVKKLILLFLLFTIVLTFQTANALKISVEGHYADEIVKVTTDKPAFIIFRMNNGTPIYANGTTAYFVPHITGKLYIEAIAGGERVSKVIDIVEHPISGGGGGGLIGDYYLPSGSTTITVDGEKVSVDYRTALGILLKASMEKGFSVKITKWSYGLFVDCIKGVCTGALGSTSGWMYAVNGEIPSMSAEQYKLHAGDDVVWYFSRSMSETPESSPYKIEMKTYSDWSFSVNIKWKEKTTSSGGNQPTVTSTPKPIPKPIAINITKKTVSKIITGNKTLEIKLKTPIKLKISTNKPVLIKVSYVKPSGIEFSRLYAYTLETFKIDVNRSLQSEIVFSLSKDTLKKYNASPNDVIVAKFNKTWRFLKTKIIRQNESYYTFSANVTNFSIFTIAIKWKGFPLNESDERIVKALNYLRSLQKDDGGFGNPNENSSISATSWAIMAIVAANEDPHKWIKNNRSPIDYLRERIKKELPKMGTADFARTILALVYSNENPRDFGGVDLVKMLKERMKSDGQIGDYIYTTIWGIIALKACGENVTKSAEWLKAHQNEDGGFAWAIGEKSDFDDTAAAIQALIAAGVARNSETIERALDYLKTGQNNDGGMRYFGNSSSNAASDSWTIQALVAAGINPVDWKKNNISVVDHLLSLQTKDGYFKYTKYVTSNPGYMTVSAIMALLGKPHPMKIVKLQPATTTVITTATTATTTATITATTTTIPTTTQVTTVTTKKTPGFSILLAAAAILIALRLRK